MPKTRSPQPPRGSLPLALCLAAAALLAPASPAGADGLDQPVVDGATVVWRHEPEAPRQSIQEVELFPDGSLAATVGGMMIKQVVYRIDPSGAVRWKRVLAFGSALEIVDGIIPLGPQAGGGMIASDSQRIVTRLREGGRPMWRLNLLDEFRVSWLTSMAAAADGTVFVGGSGERALPEGAPPDCEPATVVRIDPQGRPKWKWQFDGPGTTSPQMLLLLEGGDILAYVHEEGGGIGSGSDPCRQSRGARWLIWLDPDGRERRRVLMPRGVLIDRMERLPDGRFLAVGDRYDPQRSSILAVWVIDAEGRVVTETLDPQEQLPGWPRHLRSSDPVALKVVGDRAYLVIGFQCVGQVDDCPGRGTHAMTLDLAGRIRVAAHHDPFYWPGPPPSAAILPDGSADYLGDGLTLFRLPLDPG